MTAISPDSGGARRSSLEIGVDEGGSLHMWHEYFGPGTAWSASTSIPRARIRGRDDDDSAWGPGRPCLPGRGARRLPRIDILIDDGGHRMEQQINTVRGALPARSSRTASICARTCYTSLWPEYDAGYRHAGSFLEYTKALVDRLSALAFARSRDPGRRRRSRNPAHSMHFLRQRGRHRKAPDG